MKKFLAILFKGLFKISFFRKRFFGFHKKLFAPKNLFRNVKMRHNFHGLMIPLKLDDWIQEKLYFLDEYEGAEMKAIKNYLPNKGVFLDLGGNIGLFSLFASTKIGTGGKIIAFEPFSKNHKAFEENINRNHIGNIRLEKLAIGEVKGELTLHYDDSENNLGMVSSKPLEKGIQETVPMINLDAYLAESHLAKIDLIKIDLEGHELPALKGMLETLKKFKPAILIEILNNQDQASEKLLKELGYEKFFIDDHGNLSQTNNNSNRRNYLFIFPN